MLMKQYQFFQPRKMCSIALAALGAWFFGACADHYDGDETWSSPVRNTELASPNEEDIKIEQDKANATITISWPVVYGAGGYAYSVLNVNDPEAPDTISKGILDGCSITINREEETNYAFYIRTSGNQELGNTEAPTTTSKLFTTFEEAYASIPVGDIYEYFQQTPTPADSIGKELIFDLEPGGEYTMSKYVDFGSQQVTLRSTSKTNYATITMTGAEGGIRTSAPITLKYLKFDYAQSTQPAISMSKEPADSLKGLVGTQTSYYNITGAPIFVTNCEFYNISKNFFYDNNVSSYCIETMTLDHVKAHFNIPEQTANHAFIYAQGGFIKDLIIRNSTFYNEGEGNLQYFIRYNNSGRLDRGGYDKETETQSVTHLNNTFYNMGYSQWANYSGFSGQAYSAFNIQSNIFVDCCPTGGGIARRILGGRTASTYKTCIFNYNTYWQKDSGSEITAETSQSYDLGIILQTDPAFADAANGDFTPTGAEQLANRTGDPRWLPSAE